MKYLYAERGKNFSKATTEYLLLFHCLQHHFILNMIPLYVNMNWGFVRIQGFFYNDYYINVQKYKATANKVKMIKQRT